MKLYTVKFNPGGGGYTVQPIDGDNAQSVKAPEGDELKMADETVPAKKWDDVVDSEWVQLEDGVDVYLRFREKEPEVKQRMVVRDGKPVIDEKTGKQKITDEVIFFVDVLSPSGKVIKEDKKFSTTALVKVAGVIKKLRDTTNKGILKGLIVRITRTGKGQMVSYSVVRPTSDVEAFL